MPAASPAPDPAPEPDRITRRCAARLIPCLLGLLAAVPASGLGPDRPPSELDALARAAPAAGGRRVAALDAVAGRLDGSGLDAAGWRAHTVELGPGADVWLDLATGEPALVRGRGLPLVAGSGNALGGRRPGGPGGPGGAAAETDPAAVAAAARGFLEAHAALLTVPLAELRPLAVERVAGELWLATWEHAPGGMPVVGSRLTLVIGHGNLLMWGSEGVFPLAPEAAAAAAGGISAAQATAAVAADVGWDPGRDRLLAPPLGRWLPVAAGAGRLSAEVAGRAHLPVWELTFARRGAPGTWRARVDAATAEVVELTDVDRYGWVRGGIQPETWSDREESRPLPRVAVSGASVGFASAEGLFAGGGAPSPGGFGATLAGALATVSDRCGDTPGAPVVASGAAGNLDFGGGPPVGDGGGDCAANGVGESGGEHNTHAARTTYFHATRGKLRDRGWLPANPWLATPHELRVDLPGSCNAFWSVSGGFNGFFRSGLSQSGLTRCANTGELAAVVLHEVGHGLDQNDLQGLADEGTGEAYGDVHAMVELRDSCIGRGFLDRQCTGYGLPCTGCTGIREVDYAGHRLPGGGGPVTEPLTPANFTGPHCQGGFGIGPCGREPHCESLPGSGAVWDLAVRQLGPALGEPAAWYVVERDWTLAMQIATAMFNCDHATFDSDGCAATSWYQAMLAADDDDGDLGNGTPHAGALYAAFAAHRLACGGPDDPANTDASGCPALAAPPLTATAAGDAVALGWAPVPGATGFAVLKAHGRCDRGALVAATLGGAATGWLDTDVADHQPYAYRVVALGDAATPAAAACASAPSECAVATAGSCPAPLAAPALAVPATNRVEVGFAAPGGCGGFRVHRRRGGCGPAGEFTAVGETAAPPFVDDTVSGGVTYGYRVAPLDPTGAFEVGISPCAEATATGLCNEPPAFAPALVARSGERPSCGIDLSWSPAEPLCAGQPVVYNVYRGTEPGFAADDATRIAAGLAAPGFADTGLEPATTYYYRVRAEALSGIGPGPGGGREDANGELASGVPDGPRTALFADHLEGGTGGWKVGPGPNDATPGDGWQLVAGGAHSPDHAWFVADLAGVMDELAAIAGPLLVPREGGLLRFWHRFDTEENFDGGVLEYSIDGGASWLDVLDGDVDPTESGAGGPGFSVPADPGRFLEGGYEQGLSSCCSNPLPGRAAWTGSSGGYRRAVVDLAGFATHSVRFRWRFGADATRAGEGWWVDDVEAVLPATACSAGGLFADGFESGTLGAWSNSVTN